MAKQARKGLGRGLSALMADVEPTPAKNDAAATARGPRQIPLDRISANPDQPRRVFGEDALEELANSIREKGIIQPLILRPHPQDAGRYEIVAGERRWRASQKAQLHEVPAIVREFDDIEVLEVAIIENIQRSDLNAIEEARGYRQLMDRFGHTQEKVAEALGKSRSHIANLLRLLTLPDEVQSMLEDGRLTAGHARALITSDDPVALAREVLKKNLSVRETERLAKTRAAPQASNVTQLPTKKDADTRRLEADLAAALGMKVRIEHTAGTGGGRLSVDYRTLDQLDELCRRLSLTETSE